MFATRIELNQRACTQSALPWRPFFPVLLRVERFTARTLAESNAKIKLLPPILCIPKLVSRIQLPQG